MSGNSKLYDDPELVRFYEPENGWMDDTRFCAGLARQASSMLDLGCGTGLLLTGITHPARRVGVDPAAAMLDIGRTRPGGTDVLWVNEDARTVRLGQHFDLIVLTGHAFQVFLTDQDQAAVLSTIAAHLTPAGRFIFDTRNPAAREWEEWTPEQSMRRFVDQQLGEIEAWNDITYDEATGIATYGTYYRSPCGKVWSAKADIRFCGKDHVARLAAAAGLRVDSWLGDWTGAEWSPDSPEIIALGALA